MCVCVDTRSDSSSFRKKPRSSMCHNTSDSASCLALFLSPSFPVALDRFASLFLLYFSDGVLIDGNVGAIERENKKKDPFVLSIQSSIVDPPLNRLVSGELCC